MGLPQVLLRCNLLSLGLATYLNPTTPPPKKKFFYGNSASPDHTTYSPVDHATQQAP